MRHDLINSLSVLEHYTGAYTSAQTPSNGVDTANLMNPTAMVYVGALTNTGGSQQWTLTLEHSDSQGSGFEAVADTDVTYRVGRADAPSNGVFATVTGDNDEAAYAITYVGKKRYLRVTATPANSPGSTPISVVFVGTPHERPADDAA